MNELAVTSTQQLAVKCVSPFSTIDAFESAQRIAKLLSTVKLAPPQFQGVDNLGNIMVAMDMSNRTGHGYLTLVQNMDIIFGKPAFKATFVIASVNMLGKFTELEFEYVGKEGTDGYGCRASATKLSTGKLLTGTTITIKMAKDEGWYSRKDSKWPNMATQMLLYRAACFWQRAYAPEATLGLPSSDEVLDTPTAPAKPEIKRVIPEPLEAPGFGPPTHIQQSTGVVPFSGPIAVVPDPPSYPTEPAIAPPDMEALRAQITGEFKAAGITWKEVQSLAARDKWWDDADTLPFKSLPLEALQYLSTRVERIARTLKAPLTPATAEPTPNQ